MAPPATEPSPENGRRGERDDEEDESDGDHPVFDGLHRFRGFDGCDRGSRDQPLHDVGDDQHLDDDQNGETKLRITAGGDLSFGFPPQLGKIDLYGLF